MFKTQIDVSEILALAEIESKVKAEIQAIEADLAAATYGHIVEEAGKKLNSNKDTYLEHLSYFQDSSGVWIVQLAPEARWIEDGMPARNILEDLLKSPKAKTSATGGKYLNVPFQHNGGSAKMSAAQQSLSATIRQEMKKFKVPFDKIENDKNGVAKKGLLHSFDISKGPKSKVNQIPLLEGIKIYQKDVKNQKTGKTSTQRFVMTFRRASSSQAGKGLWDVPATPAVNLLDEAIEWIGKEIERLAPEAIERIMSVI